MFFVCCLFVRPLLNSGTKEEGVLGEAGNGGSDPAGAEDPRHSHSAAGWTFRISSPVPDPPPLRSPTSSLPHFGCRRRCSRLLLLPLLPVRADSGIPPSPDGVLVAAARPRLGLRLVQVPAHAHSSQRPLH